MSKIGLLGGAFDPIHIGHLNCANQAAERFNLKTVYFVPTAVPPHKKKYWASPSDRLAMVKLAVASNPAFKISTHEMGEEPAYTIETVRWFNKKRGADLHYIIGVDAFEAIHSWKSSVELLHECNFIVASRPGSDMREVAANIIRKFRARGLRLEYVKKWDSSSEGAVLAPAGSTRRIYFVHLPEFGVSSTEIRKRITTDKTIKYLVPDAVRQYIINRGPYDAPSKRR